MSAMDEFNATMRDFYRNKSARLEVENRQLWDVAIALLRAIGDSELDGSGIHDLRDFGELHAKALRQILESAK